MLIPARAYEVLTDAGLHLSALGVDSGADIELRDPRTRDVAVFEVKTWQKPVGPAVVDRLAHHRAAVHRLLLIAPRFSNETRQTIAALGWSWLALPETGEPEGHIKLSDGPELAIGGRLRPSNENNRKTGPRAYRRFAVIRRLLAHPDLPRQTELALMGGVSQPRVSQILSELAELGFVTKAPGARQRRWAVADWNGLLDHWLANYPGPGGVTTYWFGLDSVTQQAKSVMSYLDETVIGHLEDRCVASGDAAAEHVAPYRRSQQAVVYARHGGDLQALGLTPSAEGTSTLALTVPADLSIWPIPTTEPDWLHPRAPFKIADLVQVLWDLLHAPGPDADQAASALRRRLAAAMDPRG